MKTSMILAAGFVVGLCGAAQAQTKLVVSLYPSAAWPMNAGISTGAFAAEGLDVHLDPVTSSQAQHSGLIDGKDDMSFAALDQLIGYDAGQIPLPPGEKDDFFAFMGGEGGALHVITAPDVKRIEDLKGRTLAVDARNVGFAFVLYKIAAMHGVKQGDYNIIEVGSSQKRFDALTQGKAAGTLLDRPFDAFAVAKGFNDVLAMRTVFPHYQQSVGMARRSWATTHRDTLVHFIRGYVKASLWLFEARNKDAAIELLLKITPNLQRATAEDIYRTMTGPHGTTSPTAALDQKGVATVVALRSEYAVPKRKLDARQFYDLSYYRAAMKH